MNSSLYARVVVPSMSAALSGCRQSLLETIAIVALGVSSLAGGFGTALIPVEDLDDDGTPDLIIVDSTQREDSEASVGLIVYSLAKRKCIRVIDCGVRVSASNASVIPVSMGEPAEPCVLFPGRVGEQTFLITASLVSGEEKSRVAVGRPGYSIGWGAGGPSLMSLGAVDEEPGDEVLLRHSSVGADDYFKALVISPATALVHRKEAGLFVGTIGDVDSDGVSDYVVSMYESHSVRSGKTGKELMTLPDSGKGDVHDDYESSEPEKYLAAGDCDGDGVGDIAQFLSYKLARNDSMTSLPGRILDPGEREANRLGVKVFSGKNGKLITDLGDVAYGYKNRGSICAAGDQDGDGSDDILFSWIAFFGDCGGLRLYSGSTGKLLSESSWQQGEDGSKHDVYGYAMTSLTDLNADGLSDVALSLASRSKVSSEGERVFLLSLQAGVLAEESTDISQSCLQAK